MVITLIPNFLHIEGIMLSARADYGLLDVKMAWVCMEYVRFVQDRFCNSLSECRNQGQAKRSEERA